jgi:hypothetical protein
MKGPLEQIAHSATSASYFDPLQIPVPGRSRVVLREVPWDCLHLVSMIAARHNDFGRSRFDLFVIYLLYIAMAKERPLPRNAFLRHSGDLNEYALFCSSAAVTRGGEFFSNSRSPKCDDSVELSCFGQVTKPTTFDLAKLEKLPITSQNVTYFAAGQVASHQFTGAFWDLLRSVGGIIVDPKVKNDILRSVVIVAGSDGYASVIGAGEITPGFGGDQIMIAYAQDGQPLGQDSFAKIIASGDKMGGRFVSNISKIEIRKVVLGTDTLN